MKVKSIIFFIIALFSIGVIAADFDNSENLKCKVQFRWPQDGELQIIEKDLGLLSGSTTYKVYQIDLHEKSFYTTWFIQDNEVLLQMISIDDDTKGITVRMGIIKNKPIRLSNIDGEKVYTLSCELI